MQPNQYPPQGYPQPQQGYPPQQYAPAGYGQPAPQQGYAPQAQYAPAQQGYAPPQSPGGDEFGNPDTVGGPRARFQDAGPGRLIMISPIRIERGVPNRNAQPDPRTGQLPLQDRMTAHVVFLDGPPFMYGGDPNGDNGPAKPHTMQAIIPFEVRSMFISNVLLISQCERSVPTHGEPPRPVLGRLVKGVSTRPGGRPPWKLDNPTEADRQVARDYLRAVQEGRIVAPQPVAQQAPPAQYAPQQNAQQYAPQGSYAGAPSQGMAYAPDGQGYAPAAQQYPPQGQQPPAPPAYGGVPQGAAPQAAPVSAPPPPAPAALDTSVPPAGWAPEVWATVPEDQRQMIAAASAARPGI